jgi:hypothetical protein
MEYVRQARRLQRSQTQVFCWNFVMGFPFPGNARQFSCMKKAESRRISLLGNVFGGPIAKEKQQCLGPGVEVRVYVS